MLQMCSAVKQLPKNKLGKDVLTMNIRHLVNNDIHLKTLNLILKALNMELLFDACTLLPLHIYNNL